MSRYQAQGFDAYIERADIPEKGGVWYRVRLGRFSSREIAAQQAAALQDMLQAGLWIATRCRQALLPVAASWEMVLLSLSKSRIFSLTS